MRLEKLALHPLPAEAVLCFSASLHVLSPHVTRVDRGLPISEPAETPKENGVPGWRKRCSAEPASAEGIRESAVTAQSLDLCPTPD